MHLQIKSLPPKQNNYIESTFVTSSQANFINGTQHEFNSSRIDIRSLFLLTHLIWLSFFHHLREICIYVVVVDSDQAWLKLFIHSASFFVYFISLRYKVVVVVICCACAAVFFLYFSFFLLFCCLLYTKYDAK